MRLGSGKLTLRAVLGLQLRSSTEKPQEISSLAKTHYFFQYQAKRYRVSILNNPGEFIKDDQMISFA